MPKFCTTVRNPKTDRKPCVSSALASHEVPLRVMRVAVPADQFGGFPKLGGTFLGGPHNKDYNMLGSILGSPCFGKLPFEA